MAKTTLRDVARVAGVNVSTVSRALNNCPGVSAMVRDRVLAAARSLNYRPNLVARDLVTGRSNSIGLLISDICNPFMAEFARAVQQTAGSHGYDILLGNSALDPARQLQCLMALVDKRVAGVIMNSVAPLHPEDREALAATGLPIVLLSRSPRGFPFSSVRCDNYRGGWLAATYLLSLGHLKIAHLTSSSHHPNLQERWNGFAAAVQQQLGEKPLLLRGPHDFDGGYQMGHRLVREHPEVTAVFACNDFVALGTAKAFHEAGWRVPGDISLIGFDNVSLATATWPPLTTISQPVAEIGRAAVEIVVRQRVSKQRVPEHRMFDVSLVRRESCGPPRS